MVPRMKVEIRSSPEQGSVLVRLRLQRCLVSCEATVTYLKERYVCEMHLIDGRSVDSATRLLELQDCCTGQRDLLPKVEPPSSSMRVLPGKLWLVPRSLQRVSPLLCQEWLWRAWQCLLQLDTGQSEKARKTLQLRKDRGPVLQAALKIVQLRTGLGP